MTKQKHIPILLCSAVIAVVLCVWIVQDARTRDGKIGVKILPGKAGWGYDIAVNGRTVIHQPAMPGYGGDKGFENKTQATHAANLVISRMGTSDFPRLTREEVDSINARYHE